MRKLIVTEWITLDGVFDSDDEYFEQWFLPYHSDERAQRIQENILGCGALLMGRKTYDFLAPYVMDEVAQLKQEPGDYILTPGSGELVYSLMNAGLIDEYRFLVHPVVMGKGKRFFNGSMPFAKLNLIESEPLPLGVVALTYEPATSGN